MSTGLSAAEQALGWFRSRARKPAPEWIATIRDEIASGDQDFAYWQKAVEALYVILPLHERPQFLDAVVRDSLMLEQRGRSAAPETETTHRLAREHAAIKERLQALEAADAAHVERRRRCQRLEEERRQLAERVSAARLRTDRAEKEIALLDRTTLRHEDA